MRTVATTSCLRDTACGVRCAFVVAFACLSNVAVAGFVPAASSVSLEMCSEIRLSDWVSDFSCQELAGGGSTESVAMGQSSESDQAQLDSPHENPFFLSPVAALGNGRDSGSTGSSSVGPQTMSYSSMLPSDAIQFNPPLVSRLDADENLRLPLKLPYKLFRPPKFRRV